MPATFPLASLAATVDRLGDRVAEWAATHGVAVVTTLVVATLALRFGTALIDQVQAALPTSTRPELNARRAQRTLTLTTILRSTLRAVVLFATLLSVLSAVGINITPILASAGVVGLAVGFGAQSLVKDVISGFFILFEDQYGVGDAVDIDGKSGMVERMNLRITQLRNTAGELITVPNGSIKIVSNQSKEWARAVLDIPIASEADIDHAMHLILEEGARLRLDWPERALEAPEAVGVSAFGEGSIHLKALMKCAPLQHGSIATEWRRRVKYAFDREGVKMPTPQRTLRILSGDPKPIVPSVD